MSTGIPIVGTESPKDHKPYDRRSIAFAVYAGISAASRCATPRASSAPRNSATARRRDHDRLPPAAAPPRALPHHPAAPLLLPHHAHLPQARVRQQAPHPQVRPLSAGPRMRRKETPGAEACPSRAKAALCPRPHPCPWLPVVLGTLFMRGLPPAAARRGRAIFFRRLPQRPFLLALGPAQDFRAEKRSPATAQPPHPGKCRVNGWKNTPTRRGLGWPRICGKFWPFLCSVLGRRFCPARILRTKTCSPPPRRPGFHPAFFYRDSGWCSAAVRF